MEGPSELIYLQLASSFVVASGAPGLREDLTIVPTGGLDNVATFVALLGASGLKLAVLHDYKGSPEQKLTGLVREKLLAGKALFNVAQFRTPGAGLIAGQPTDIEDLFDVALYIEFFNATFGVYLGKNKVKEADLPTGDRIVQRLERWLVAKGVTVRPSGGFNHYLVASRFASHPPSELDAATMERFKALFTTINATF